MWLSIHINSKVRSGVSQTGERKLTLRQVGHKSRTVENILTKTVLLVAFPLNFFFGFGVTIYSDIAREFALMTRWNRKLSPAMRPTLPQKLKL